MAFTFSKTDEFVAGDLRFTMGTFTSAGGSTGGDIYTGLQKVEALRLTHKSDAAVATFPVINETFPKADPITVVTAANGVGWWIAMGH